MLLQGRTALTIRRIFVSKGENNISPSDKLRLKQITIAISVTLVLALLSWLIYRSGRPELSNEDMPAALERISKPWTGDLDEAIAKRRFIRVLVTYNQTNFFIDQGTPRGIEYDLLKRYETYLNKNQKGKGLKFKLIFTVMPFDRLLSALVEGQGDIVAAGLTITPERLKKVDFTMPYITDVSEILVAAKGTQDITSIQDLSGRKVYVLAGSSYVTHLEKHNRILRAHFLAPIRIVEVDPHLEEEDLLQMINAAIYDFTVTDEHIAELWSKVLENIQVLPNIEINSGGRIAWAVRKNNPRLLASLNEFLQTHRQGTFAGNMLIKRYYENTRWIRNPLKGKAKERIEALKLLFQKYARRYKFDWLKVAALAYQESRLNQDTISHRGAVGIMQILPSTAAGPAIAIADIHTVDNNIHAGTKYLAYLRDTYFDDPEILPENRIDFAMAAYNAGPARINYMRKKAARMGLNANLWFSNVEVAARKFIGREPVQYVSNIYIYYVAYRSAFRVVNRKPETDPFEKQENSILLQSD